MELLLIITKYTPQFYWGNNKNNNNILLQGLSYRFSER